MAHGSKAHPPICKVGAPGIGTQAEQSQKNSRCGKQYVFFLFWVKFKGGKDLFSRKKEKAK